MDTKLNDSILGLLAKENYISFSKPIAKKIGIDEAILFGELCSINYYFNDNEFYCEQEKLIEDTCLTEYRVRNALKNLQNYNLISIVKKGLPARNFYKLNSEVLLLILSEYEIQRTSGAKFDTTGGCKNDTTNK